MDLINILNCDYHSVLNTSSSDFYPPISDTVKSNDQSDLVHNVPCYFSKDQIDLYKKVIQLHYSDILQLINSDSADGEISDYIKNSMDLLSINLESVSIHPYALIMSKLPNSNRQLVFKEFVKSQLLSKSGKLYTLKLILDNLKQNKTKKNVVVYFRGDFNINELYDFEQTNYRHLSYIPGDITQEHQLRRNTISDIKIAAVDSKVKREEEDEDDEEEEVQEVQDEEEDDEINSNSEEEQYLKSKPNQIKEETIQNSIGGRSSTFSLSSTTQPTRICDILEAVLTASLSTSASGKMVVKRYDGKKPLKRGYANQDDETGNGNSIKDELQVHLISNMEVEFPVKNPDLIITLDSTYPSSVVVQNVEMLRLFTPLSVDQFLMIKDKTGMNIKQVIMNVVCNKDRAGSLSDEWILEYLEGLKNVASNHYKSESINQNFVSGDKILAEKILEESDDLFGDFLQNYVDALDSGDSIFNFLRFVKGVDSRINFAELTDNDLVNVRKLVKNKVFLKDDDSSIHRNTFKINKNLVINFDQRILYQLNRGVRSGLNHKDYKNIDSSLLYTKLQRALANLEMSEHLSKSIDAENEFYEGELDKLIEKILVEGIKFTEDANKEVETCLAKQKSLREQISQTKTNANSNSEANDLASLSKKVLDKENEAEYLKQEIAKANTSIANTDAEILQLQQKLKEVDDKIAERTNSSLFKRKASSNIAETNKEKIESLMEKATELYTNIKELPLKRSKRQRRR